MTDERLLGAIARGWCHETTSDRIMDTELAKAIAAEVQPLLNEPRLGLATTLELIDELKARAESEGYGGYLGA